MKKKNKNVPTNSVYIEHLLILASAVTGCISVSPFASLAGFPMGIASSTVGLKITAITHSRN